MLVYGLRWLSLIKTRSNASIGKLRNTSLSTDCSSSGIRPARERCPSRYESSVYTVLSLNVAQDLVLGLDGVMFNGLMENIEWFFSLHDKNKDGFLTRDEVLTVSESFLVSLS